MLEPDAHFARRLGEPEAALIEDCAADAVAELKTLYPDPDRRKCHYAGRKGRAVNFRLPSADAELYEATARELGHDLSGFVRQSLKIAAALVRPYRLIPAWTQAVEQHGPHSIQAQAIEAAFNSLVAEVLPPPPWRQGEHNSQDRPR